MKKNIVLLVQNRKTSQERLEEFKKDLFKTDCYPVLNDTVEVFGEGVSVYSIRHQKRSEDE